MTGYHQSTQKFFTDNCGKCYLVADGCPYGECVPCYVGADLIEKGVEGVNKTKFYLPDICPSRKVSPSMSECHTHLSEEEKK